jgi:hypothetical protein
LAGRISSRNADPAISGPTQTSSKQVSNRAIPSSHGASLDQAISSRNWHKDNAPVVVAPSAPPPPPPAPVGAITSFSTTPGSVFHVGGDKYEVETAGKSYSITNPDAQTLRFEVHQGDNWAGGGDGAYCDRSEIQNDTKSVTTSWGAKIPAGTPTTLDYQFMVEANSNGAFVNTQNHNNGWFAVGQMHNDDIASGVGTSPPFALQMDGDKLQVVARYVTPGGNPSNSSSALKMLTLWTDPNPVRAGVYRAINVRANFSNSSGGYLQVSIDGTQVVNYQGPLGYGQGTYWEYGIYRSRAAEIAAVRYRNMHLATG